MNNAIGNHDCPPIMSDGRHFTDYRPSCYVHDLILRQNGISNSYDLKMLLTHNATKLQDINQSYYDLKNSCVSCGKYYLVDPNNSDTYWNQYKSRIGYDKK
jgi:hypothetical protein